jgi:acetylornithine deacetylase/succinyl-diaminopimelate desuccinylase-like protein
MIRSNAGRFLLYIPLVALSLGLAVASSPAAADAALGDRAFAREALRQLVEFDSSADHGTADVAAAIAGRLRDAGFAGNEVTLLTPAEQPSRANVVVRLHGSGHAKPLLIIGHIDVVGAPRETWSVDPFKLTEQGGFFYGRGVLDMKGEDAAVLTALARMKREGFSPDRDIIAAFTADEEAGSANGVQWLLKNHRDLVDAALAINPDEGAAGLRQNKRVYYGIQTSAKRYITYRLETVGKSGHTAIPQPDNAIYKLAAGLTRLSTFRFPIELDDTTRAYFTRTAVMESGQTRTDMIAVSGAKVDLAAAERLARNPERNANLRTTCVATLLQAGTVENALADSAQATVQCRVLPGDSPEFVRNTLEKVLKNPAIRITVTDPGQDNPASSLTPQIMSPVEAAVHSLWPGVLVIPSLSIGASDSVYTRAAGIPTYGLCSIFYDLDDDRAHGDDERIGVDNFYEGVEFMYRLLKTLSQAAPSPLGKD